VNVLRTLIPRMFHRRLLLLFGVMASATVVLGGRLIFLAGFQGDEHLLEAENALERRTLTKMVRGKILDRRGRILARERACWNIVVDYDVITGRRAQRLASSDVRRHHRPEYLTWDPPKLEAVTAEYRRDYEAHDRQIWEAIMRWGDIDADELRRRRSVIQRRIHLIRAARLERAAGRRERELGEPVSLREVSEPIAEEVEPHTILRDVTPAARNAFSKLRIRLIQNAKRLRSRRKISPGVKVVDATIRDYPFRQKAKVAADSEFVGDPEAGLIGRMRENIWKTDIDESQGGRPFRRRDGTTDLGGYLPGDRIGIGGIEQAEEARLRGLWGQKIIRKDTNDESRTAPQDGEDVHLTLDIELQRRIQNILEPTTASQKEPVTEKGAPRLTKALAGAIVIMEVDTGEVLALGSAPTVAYRNWAKKYDPAKVKYIQYPGLNRAVGAIYPPGSTVKPIVYAIATSQGVIPPHRHIDCTGYLLPGHPTKYRCWKYKMYKGMHGPVGPDEALARSCNIYFYKLGQMLGGDRLAAGYRAWGFGSLTNIGVGREEKGLVADRPEDLKKWDAILMGIGQGKIAVTPLQLAAAHATLARGGEYLSPLLVAERRPEQKAWTLQVPPKSIELALKGMSESLTYGTAKRVKIMKMEGLKLRAKTGTAQAPDMIEVDAKGRKHVLKKGDHSWFVCHVQRSGERRAAYVIVAVVEYGGSGGKVAGPVVNQVLHALKAEGYLEPKSSKSKSKSKS
jgi:penicillin-binding protein 2